MNDPNDSNKQRPQIGMGFLGARDSDFDPDMALQDGMYRVRSYNAWGPVMMVCLQAEEEPHSIYAMGLPPEQVERWQRERPVGSRIQVTDDRKRS